MSKPSPMSSSSGVSTRQGVRPTDLTGMLPRGGEDATAYAAALAWLSERINVERSRPTQIDPSVWKLDRMRELMRVLGNPERDVRCVHVAGSKGKGSVVEMTASALVGCGYTTGIYTSPHLVDLRERVRINHRLIPYGDFARLCREIESAGKSIAGAHGEPTYFEILTALAFLHFQQEAVDVAVIEVGLGGRLDATNVIDPLVTAVTAIQLEHTQILGDTLAKIAREKAGIFKAGVPALTFPQAGEVMEVFRAVAADVGAPLMVVGQDIEFSQRFEHSPELGHHTRVSLSTPRSNFEHVPVPLKGEHQASNAGLVLGILDQLRARGFETPELKVSQGLSRTPSHGRLELVWKAPRIVVDGAHTPDSVDALIKTLGAHVKCDSMIVVFGCAADKDLAGMVRAIGQGADKIYFTRASNNPRSVEPRELARKYAELTGRTGVVTPSLDEAVRRALQTAQRGDLVVVTGSYYVAGEAKRWVQANLGSGGGGAH